MPGHAEGCKMHFIQRFNVHLNVHPNLLLWVLVFLITTLIILLVQLVLLPLVFPAWHAGGGLLVGGDWLNFHEKAVVVAERIDSYGWSAWELRPKGWLPTGISAAVYAITWPEPWTMAPINAALQATTFLVVMKLLLLFTDNRKLALIAAIPFAFFPSAMLWYTQIHRDSYYILGIVLFIYGFLLTARLGQHEKFEIRGIIYLLCGLIIIWLVRPHSLDIFFYTTLLLSIVIAAAFAFMSGKSTVTRKQFFLKLLSLVLIVIFIYPLKETQGALKYLNIPEAVNHIAMGEETDPAEADAIHHWQRSAWLPESVDNRLYSVAYLRSVSFPARFGEAASSIDFDVSFHSAEDFVRYLPRALQVAFLAPFPADWFSEGGHASTSFFRRISAFEMLFVYLMLAALAYGFWLWRKKIEFYILILFCAIMMMPIVYGVPNVGTIYRYRYGYLMLLVSLGVIAISRLILKWRRSSKPGERLK